LRISIVKGAELKYLAEKEQWPKRATAIAARAASCLGKLAKSVPEGMIGQVIEEYERAYRKGRATSESAASNITDLAEAAPQHRMGDVISLWQKYITRGGKTADSAAKSLRDSPQLVRAGKISLQDALALYDLAFENNALEGIKGSLPSFAKDFPREGLELYKRVYEATHNKHEIFIENELVIEFDGTLRHIKFPENVEDPKIRDEFELLKLIFISEEKRLERLHEIYERERRIRHATNEEIIDAYVQRYCRHLKPHQRTELAEFLIDRPRFARAHANLLMDGGYSSEEIIDITGDVVKTASIAQNRREDLVYSLEAPPKRFCVLEDNLLGEFGMFIPRKRGELIRLNDGMSLLVLDDLRKREPGQKIAGMMYMALTGQQSVPWETSHKGHNAAMYNLFLLGFAHKCLTKAEDDAGFPESQYTTLTGIPHYRAIMVPLPNTSERVYQELMKPVDRKMVGRCGKVIDKFIEHAKGREDRVVAIGDNKVLENMKNGYMHDFACVGWGLEVEDITYGLVEPRLGIPLQNMKNYVRAYTWMRCLHDEDFRQEVMEGKADEMLALTDAATLKALSIYASCTRKRVQQMESGEIVPRRNFFINALEFMLNTGDYTAMGVQL
jgi:hypothetical protein